MGIILAAHAIAARKAKDENICILTDSMAVLQALNSYTVNSGLIHECHLILNDLGAVNNINLRWIKGHSGSRGNDAADELARKGSGSRAIGPEPIVPLPLGYLRSQVTSRSHDQHSALWDCISECRQTREVLPMFYMFTKIHKKNHFT
ncbi:ribonuclease H-like [Papilio machaon]|uniref:ribonuclease H-like n=1 Tax=Papilio machaon TaxID=76193 RepID=UPI001E664857|nr:ribonuclease H-like [Papilio machaon]